MKKTTTTLESAQQSALELAHERLAQAVESISSQEGWTALLKLRSRLHSYSLNNLLLIFTQRPDATYVAGYQRWADLGRQVRKGEKGIAILAPITRKAVVEVERDGEIVQEERRWNNYRVVYVFDISQTDGPDAPAPALPVLLAGEAPEGAQEAAEAFIIAQGFAFSLGTPEQGANGVTDHGARRVVVRDDVDPAQRLKTTLHEAAHVILHADRIGCRGAAEVEAESVAFLVCSHFGLDSGQYTFSYVTGWAGGDPRVVQDTAQRVLDAASTIISTMEGAA